MSESLRNIALAGLRSRQPELSPEELSRELLSIMYGFASRRRNRRRTDACATFASPHPLLVIMNGKSRAKAGSSNPAPVRDQKTNSKMEQVKSQRASTRRL